MQLKTFHLVAESLIKRCQNGLSATSSRSHPPPPSKKRRKSRTAFTNHQLYELERRFIEQKYLLPADRDAISDRLGLTNTQVITWFQNRRAKLKRDLDELRADVDAARSLESGTFDDAVSATATSAMTD